MSHAPEYGAEFIGTAFLVFCVVGAVGLMFAPSSVVVTAIPSVGARLFLTGLVLGGAGSLVAITPVGRISGAHLNPAISLAFYSVGRMHLQDLFGYIAAQTAGATLGAWGGQLAFGTVASAVHDALNQPGDHVSALWALGGEIVATFALTAVVLVMLSRRSLMRWTPLAAVGVVAVIVWLDGDFSGASLNPARSFGPAIVTGDWHLFWVYVIGPCCGSVSAGLLHHFVTPLETLTGKLFHDLQYRSIFTGPFDHVSNRHLRHQAAVPGHLRPPVHTRATEADHGESRVA